jgi:hypothetical protein
MPYFAVVLFLQLIPVLWPERVDTCEPVVLNGPTGIFSSAYLISSLCYFLFRGGLDMSPLLGGLSAEESVALCRKVLVAMALTSASFMAGYYNDFLGIRFSRLFPKVQGLEWHTGRLKVASVAIFILACGVYAIFQIRVGVSLSDITQLGAGKAVWRDDPTMTWMLRGVQLAFIPVFLYGVRSLAEGNRFRLLVIAVAMVAAALMNLRLGQRGIPLYALLAAMVIFHYMGKRISAGVLVLALVLSIFASNLMLRWRTEYVVRSVRSAATETSSVGEDILLALGDHEAERQRFAVNGLLFYEWPEKQDYLLGETWLPVFVALIPRWIWPEKGDSFQWADTRIVLTLRGAPIPSPFPAILYINFSWIGLVLGMFIWGGVMRGLYLWLQQQPRDRNLVVLYAMFLLYLGPTGFGISSTLQYVVPVWAVIKFLSWRYRPGARLAEAQVAQAAAG